MFPFMKSSPTYTLNIPELSGGMNLRDGISLVGDNQLTDCKNMWYKDGMLRTRPRILSNTDGSNLRQLKSISDNISPDVRMYSDIKFIDNFNGVVYYLSVVKAKLVDSNNKQTYALFFMLVDEKYPESKLDIAKYGFVTDAENVSYVCFKHEGDIYCFVSDGKDRYEILQISQGQDLHSEWSIKKLTPEELYAPLVAVNCLPTNQITFVGSMINGYNLLSSYCKVEYSSINPDVTDPWFWKEGDEKKTLHKLVYYSPWVTNIPYSEMKNYAGLKVTAELTNKDGKTVVHEAVIGENGLGREESGSEDGFVIEVTPVSVKFFIDDGTWATEARAIDGDVQIRNNLVITFPTIKTDNYKKVVNMTRSIWFGGNYYGLFGGSRLFLTGNTDEKERALVIWSDLNNPLYFPENGFAYIGDDSQSVTAFGRMSNNLVIFKERELYQTQYVQMDTPTSESVISQSVIDLSQQSAYFPLVLINGNIGCDCPDTVQLCRNRLVWADSHGKVYTLVSQNQYNERSVFEISQMIERRLKGEADLKKAHSADYMGHYILQINKKMYVMDYNSYGYNYVSSYSKTEDANIQIPWHYWELCVDPIYMAEANGKLVMWTFNRAGVDDDNWYWFIYNTHYIDGESGDDETLSIRWDNDKNTYIGTLDIHGIPSTIQTKLFDFGQPAKLKSVPMINVSFGYNDARPITVEFISEKQITDEHTITVEGAKAGKYSPEYVHQCRLFPYTKGTVMFGAKITCEGEMAIDSMSLQYKQLGGAK